MQKLDIYLYFIIIHVKVTKANMINDHMDNKTYIVEKTNFKCNFYLDTLQFSYILEIVFFICTKFM